jgi:type IV pilus assembly protein PilM
LGANTVETKVFETLNAISNGADEIDMVMNIGEFKQGNYDYVEDEINQVVPDGTASTYYAPKTYIKNDILEGIVIDSSDEEHVLVVDMGLENTSFAIYERGFPIFTSSGSVSGKMLTDMIMKNKGLAIEKAESYKVKIGLGSTPEEKQESFTIFEPALVTFVDEIKRALNFFNETLAIQRDNISSDKVEINKIILTGGGANLKGLSSYLSINLQETIEQSNPWINVRFKEDIPPVSKEDSQGFSTVIGLALRAQEYESYN